MVQWSGMALIELSSITKSFGKGENETLVLKDVSLKIEKGQFIALMGPSGSGKSTLMNIIGLLDKPTGGDYRLDDKLVADLSDRKQAKLRRKRVGFIFQTFNLLPRLTVRQNVELPMIYAGYKLSVRHKRSETLLKHVGLSDRLNYRPNQLSGGQMQRVAIARALANKPTIILADEPTGNLDSKSGEQIMQLLLQLHKQGSTILMVTHNDDLAKLADRIVHIKDGQVTDRGGKK